MVSDQDDTIGGATSIPVETGTGHSLLIDLAAMIAETPASLAILNRDLQVVGCSQLWLALHGRDPAPGAAVLPDPFPDRPGTWAALLARGLAGEGLASGEDRTGWLWQIRPILDHAGAVIGVSVLTGALPEPAPLPGSATPTLGLFERRHDSDEFILSWDFRRMLGLEPDHLPADLGAWLRLLRPEDPQALARLLIGTPHLSPEQGFALELRPVIAGQARRMQLIGHVEAAPEPGAERSPRSIAVLMDRTEAWQTQEMLNRNQRLETMGQVAGSVAHDLNNILTVIQGDLERARQRSDEAEIRALIDRALEASAMGVAVAQRLMRVDGRRDPAPETVELDRHVRDSLPVLERMLRPGIALRFAPGAGEEVVAIPPGDLDAALLNLVLNAQEAMAEGGEVLAETARVILSPQDAALIPGGRPGAFLRLRLSDGGSGMSPEVAAQALQPFFTTREQGSGLGLTSVGLTAARLGGFLDIDSRPGQGTQVSIYLPRTELWPPRAELTKAEIPVGNGELILLVEPDPAMLDTLAKRLEVIGYAVIDAADPAAALAMLEAGEPVDLVICEARCPGSISGLELLTELHRLYPQIGLLLLSGPALQPAPPAGDEAEGIEILKGPATLAPLSGAIRRALLSRGGGIPVAD